MPDLPPNLRIRIKKKTDGAAALSCARADGSVTWQRQEGQLGKFFPLHDLTHYSVETVLGLRRAFYGLVAEGWDISAFGTPESRGSIPEEATLAEMIVGYFDLERMTGVLGTAEEYNERIRTTYAEHRKTLPPLELTADQVARIRELRGEVIATWRALPAGGTMEVSFTRGTGIEALR